MAIFGNEINNIQKAVPKPPVPGKSKTLGASLTGLTAAPIPVAKPQAPPAPAPAAPAAPSAAPASPLDSTYYGNIAANQLKVNNSINSLNTSSANDNTALQAALGQLAYQQPRDQLKLEQAANRTGGLFSSVEGQNQGNLLNQYQTKQSADTTANAQKQAAIASQIAALQQGEGLFNNGQYDDAVARAAKAAAANPATGQAPVAPVAPAATLAARAAASSAQASQKAALAKALAAASRKGNSSFVQTSARSK